MKNWAARAYRFGREFAVWVTVKAWPIWATFLGVAAAALVAWIVSLVLGGDLEAVVRYAGTLLQLLGIAVVARGIRDTRSLFNRKTWFQEFWESRPRWHRAHYLHAGTGALNASLGGAQLHASGTISGDLALESRVAALEVKARQLTELSENLRRDIEIEARERREAINSEATARSEEDRKLHTLIDTALAGGLRLESIGVVWLAVGVLASGFVPEIAGWISAAR